MSTQLSQMDQHALGRSLQAYRKLSARHADEVNELLRSDGWKETAMHCARCCQQIEQNLDSEELAPCEIRNSGIILGEARPEMVAQRNNLSRYEPSPQLACEAAERRRRESGGSQEEPSSAA